MRVLGQGTYDPYGALGEIGLGELEWVMLLFLGAAIIMILPLARLKRRIDLD